MVKDAELLAGGGGEVQVLLAGFAGVEFFGGGDVGVQPAAEPGDFLLALAAQARAFLMVGKFVHGLATVYLPRKLGRQSGRMASQRTIVPGGVVMGAV